MMSVAILKEIHNIVDVFKASQNMVLFVIIAAGFADVDTFIMIVITPRGLHTRIALGLRKTLENAKL